MLDLKSKIIDDFPEIEDVDYIFKDLPEPLEEFASPAFYLIPPIDNEEEENIIYINNSQVNETNIFTVFAHEGYPGHLYQENYINDMISPLRSVLNFSGYNEGWALYAELFCYDLAEYAMNAPECAEFIRLNNQLNYALLSKMDIGINYVGWSLDQAIEEMSPFINETRVIETYEMLTQEPCIYIKYFSTYRKIDALRQKTQNAIGDDFNLKEFHKVILDIGPSYFDIVEQAVDKYIASFDINDELLQAS